MPSTRPPQEFTDLNKYTWIIGRFESFRVYDTIRHGGLYTEMTVKVQHIFGVPPPNLSDGRSIDIDVAGGSALDSHGQRIEFLDDDYLPMIQPGHTYLMEVIPCLKFVPCSVADFYFPSRKWDLTSGTIQPVDEFDIRFALTGKSQLAGKSSSAIVPLFDQLLSKAALDDAN